MNNQVNVSFGATRDQHAAMIQAEGRQWGQYAALHNQAFAERGLEKYKLVNTEGKIVNSSTDPRKLNAANVGSVRHEDFLTIQDEIVAVRRRALNGITDLRDAGLTFPVGIEKQLVGFENVSEHQAANQDMNPTAYQNNTLVIAESFVPNPITHQSFTIPWRQTGFDYKSSLGMSESNRQVAERLEETLFNGNASISVNYGGTNQVLYGYTTHPNRGTDTISDWSLVASNALVIPELIEQIGLMWSTQGGVGNKSVVVYVGNGIWNQFQQDYKAGVTGSIMERAGKIAQIKDIKPAEKLADNAVVLVEMDRRTVQMATASDIITVPHTKTDPFMPQIMTTYAAMVQQIKVDSKGNTGVRHLTV